LITCDDKYRTQITEIISILIIALLSITSSDWNSEAGSLWGSGAWASWRVRVIGELGAATVLREVDCERGKWGRGSRCARGSKGDGVMVVV
jgi:hypothetical protein